MARKRWIRCAAVAIAGMAAGCGGGDPVVHDLVAASAHTRLRVEPTLEFTAAERSQGFLVAGWSRPEISGETTYAWATGRQASLVLPVFSADRNRLHFRCRALPGGAQPQTMHVRLNGTPMGSLELRQGFSSYSLPLPAGSLAVGDNRLDFHFSRAVRLSEQRPGSGDERLLAAAFDTLGFSSGQDPPPPTAPAVQRTIGDRLLQPAGSELAFPVTIPRRGVLEFGLSATADGGASARVVLRRPGSPERVLFASQQDQACRRRRRLDLAELASERAEIVLQVLGDSAGLAWERPRLLGDAGGMDLTSDVVLIVVDTLRADLLSVYGGDVATPNLETLAASGVRFERAWAHAPMTMPSHASMFTSLLPSEHRALINTHVLGDGHSTLAELLRHGYRRTAGFVSLGVLSRSFGIAQGFDEYHDRFAFDWWKTAEEMNRQVLPWLAARGPEPFFLWVHYSDPHEPYRPPGMERPRMSLELDGTELGTYDVDATHSLPVVLDPGSHELAFAAATPASDRPLRLQNVRALSASVTVACGEGCAARIQRNGRVGYELRLPASLMLGNRSAEAVRTELRLLPQEISTMGGLRQRYRAEIEYVDREIGRLLGALERTGRRGDALILLTSDHGEALGEHDLGGHIDQLYDTLLRVPLIIAWPGRLPAGRVVEEPVSHVDLLPTVADLLGIPDRTERAGVSLVPLMRGLEDGPVAAPIFAETFRPEAPRDLQAVVHRGFKLIHAPDEARYELYDLTADPGERADLAAVRPGAVRELRALLEARMAAAGAGDAVPEAGELSAEDRERLRALGYLR